MMQLKVTHPTGEVQKVRYQAKKLELGWHSDNAVQLLDPDLNSSFKLHLFPNPVAPPEKRPPWFQVEGEAQGIWIEDQLVREGELPFNTPAYAGSTQFELEAKPSSTLRPLKQPEHLEHWLSTSDKGRKLLHETKTAAQTGLPIALYGETGTGKEILANLIHAWSSAHLKPFVPLNCGALPKELAESELFGHVRGSFTGAHQNRSGALKQADGGTVFLDEIGDLAPDLQVKLLRFLENGEIRPVGSDRVSYASVRVICATHRPLGKLVERGEFREDLYYRLTSIQLAIPPLRERPEDIPYLAQHFAQKTGDHFITRAALNRLKGLAWQGNVRELRNAVELASSSVPRDQKWLRFEDFKPIFKRYENSAHHSFPQPKAHPPSETPVLSLEQAEKQALIHALQMTEGHKTKSAQLLGIARSTLFAMMKRHGLATSYQVATQ